MLNALTVLELFEALSPAEQERCRVAIIAAPAPASKPKKQTLLRPEHATVARMKAFIIKSHGITFKETNLQAAMFANPAR